MPASLCTPFSPNASLFLKWFGALLGILPRVATAAFDTLQAAREIEAAGLERAQAETIAQAIRRRSEDHATKGDIALLKDDIAALRAEVATMIEKAKNSVLLAILAAVGILAAIGLFA